MITTVTYLSELEAATLVPSGNHAIVSVTEPGRHARLHPGWQSIFRTQFIDTEYDEHSLRFAGIDWWVASGAFAPDQALALRDHLQSLHPAAQSYDLVCHCHAGQSRSAAVAQYVATTFGATMLKAQSPKANRTVLHLLEDPWRYITEREYKKLTGRSSRLLGWLRAFLPW